MKINLFSFKFAVVTAAAMILAIFITKPAVSQEPAKTESHKKITMKIFSDDNGKVTIYDTTMEMPDSAMVDSLKNEIEKVIILGKGGKHSRVRVHNMPDEFNYKFEMPYIPECNMNLEELEDLDLEGMMEGCDMDKVMCEHMAPGCERMIRSGGKGQSLNDLLGEIPMDRVVSYSIKDRKNGKRIIIDLNDAPTFERQERVIIVREPRRNQHVKNNQERQVRVIVNTDDDEKMESKQVKTETPSTPPTPPEKPKK